MSNSAGVQQAELTLTVLSGTDKGATYKLVSQTVRIGRAADNDVVLQDPRCSRNHAVIEFKQDGIYITNSSPSNPIDVDGIKTEKALLKTGSHIHMGSTVLKFEIRVASMMPTVPSAIPQGLVTPQNNGVTQTVAQADYIGPVQRSVPRANNRTPLYVGITVIGLLLMFVMSEPSVQSESEDEVRTETALEEELKATQERLSVIEKDQVKRGVGTPEYKEVQALITQGMRDYREGQYGRALLALDSALALRPDSETARKYRDLSKRRFDELIQTTMLEGRRYREQGKYALAAYAYKQVMIFINDTKNKQYQEAQELSKEAELLMKGAY